MASDRKNVGTQADDDRPKLSREKTTSTPGKKKRRSSTDRKKMEESFRNWEAAKKMFRQADLARSQEKVQLQRQLIQKRSDFAQLKRKEREESETKERERKRIERKEKEQALMGVCQESIRRDRLIALNRKRNPASTRGSVRDNLTSRSIGFTSSSSDTAPDSREYHSRRPYLLSSSSAGGALETTTGSMGAPLCEEDEDDFERKTATTSDDAEYLAHLTEEELNLLPNYKRFMYQHFGNKADYYLHPKQEQKARQPLSAKLKTRRHAHLGAEELWYLLRGDSQQKLLKVDSTIPPELKETFGSFVRQFIHPKRPPVSRNFSRDEDVPDLVRLMDHRILSRVRDFRHKVELMYRSSQNNKDRTDVLSLNNPLPDFGEGSQDAGVGRYIPSWIQALQEEKVMDNWEAGSKKSISVPDLTSLEALPHLQPLEEEVHHIPHPEENLDEAQDTLPELASRAVSRPGRSRASGQTSITQASGESWDFMLVKKRNTKPKKQQRYDNLPKKIHFMKEEDAVVEGQFTQRHREAAENARHGAEYQSSDSSYMKPATPGSERPHTSGSEVRRTAVQQNTTQWVPLSMAAVTEYTPIRSGQGEGDFNQGRAAVWAAQSSVVAS